jgi:hypothetical protein
VQISWTSIRSSTKLPTSRNATPRDRSTLHHSLGPARTRIPTGIAILALLNHSPPRHCLRQPGRAIARRRLGTPTAVGGRTRTHSRRQAARIDGMRSHTHRIRQMVLLTPRTTVLGEFPRENPSPARLESKFDSPGRHSLLPDPGSTPKFTSRVGHRLEKSGRPLHISS